MWSFGVYETDTGDMVAPVQPADCSWTRKLDNRGTGSFTFKVNDPFAYPGNSPQTLFREDDRTIVVYWDDNHPAYAGVIDELSYDWGRKTVTVQTRELRQLFENRYTGRPDNYSGEGWDFLIDHRMHEGILALIDRATSLGPGYELAIAPNASGGPGAGGHWRREIHYYEVISVDDLLAEAEAQGVLIDFAPDLRADGSFAWVLVTARDLDRDVTPLVVGAPYSPVTSLTAVRSSRDRRSGVLSLGKGEGMDMKTGYAQGQEGRIARDGTLDLKDEEDVPQLMLAAQEEQKLLRNAATKWTLGVELGDQLRPWDMRVGRTLEIHTPGDPYLVDGPRDKVVLAVSGGMGNELTVEVTDPDDS